MTRDRKKQAVAVSYKTGQMNAPVVTAQGNRAVAQQMTEIARRYGVPVITNPKLTEQLGQLAVDQEIPDTLYEPVARVLVSAGRKGRSR